MSDIHWFPGHMKKAKNEIQDKVKVVDVVLELIDARAPFSTRNLELEALTNNKPRLIVLTKKDLSDENISNSWINYFTNENTKCILANLNDRNIIKDIEKLVEELASKKREKEKARGMKPQPVRAMIIGIPNVGKSTLINKITHQKSAGVENKPGFTRSQQWIRINKNFELLDTPGVLPMKYEDKKVALNLALIGSIREDILPLEELANSLINFLNNKYPNYISKRYNFDVNNLTNEEIINKIALSRGYLNKGQLNIELAEKTLLNEFKNGILGRASLEEIDNA